MTSKRKKSEPVITDICEAPWFQTAELDLRIPTIPTPAPAFSVTLREDNAYSLGVLRFMPNIGEKKPVYIGPPVPDGSGECTLTTSIEKALQFRYDHNSPSNLRILESLVILFCYILEIEPNVSSTRAMPPISG